LLGSQIVGNYLDLTTCRLAIHDLGQKIDKFRTGVAGAGFSQHLSRFECSERHRVKGFHGCSTRSHAVQRDLEKAAKPDPGDPAPGWRSSESTQKTAACAGSLRYKPMMSAAFHFKLRIITGHITNYATSAVGAQIAATLDWLTPTSLARR
jgi:hypothetical protein